MDDSFFVGDTLTRANMLARTLYLLRTSPPERKLDLLAHAFDVSTGTLRNWEDTGKDASSFKLGILEKYQNFYGIPPGVTLLISQLTALAVEGESAKIELLAKIMFAIAKRVSQPEPGRPKITELKTSLQNSELWDKIIHEIFESVRRDIPDQGRYLFRTTK